jgi:hypothetical protein
VSPVRYEVGIYSPEDGILHSRRRENLRSCELIDILHFTVQTADLGCI